MTNYKLPDPAWARDFNNQPRHCWPRVDGTRTLRSDPSQLCERPLAHHDPRAIGQVEWMRFIHAVGKLLPDNLNPFTSEGSFKLLNDYAHPTTDGRITYAETYLRCKPESWGLSPVFRVFLANDSGWARIECYDDALVGICEQALEIVEQSYAVPA